MSMYPNPYRAPALQREAVVRRHRRRHHPLVEAARVVAIATSVAVLWAASFAASYEWLAPTLAGGR